MNQPLTPEPLSGPCMLHGRMDCGDCFNIDIDIMPDEACSQCGLEHISGFCPCNCLLDTNDDCLIHSLRGGR